MQIFLNCKTKSLQKFIVAKIDPHESLSSRKFRYNAVNLAKSVDAILHGLNLEVAVKGVEVFFEALENTVRQLDLKSLIGVVDRALIR